MDEDIQTLLLCVSEDLGQRDLQAMVFLCEDNLRTAEKETITDGRKLFSILQKKDLVSKGDLSFLKEILYRIGRRDILRKRLKLTAQEMKDLPNCTRRISPYRSLLYDISESLCKEDVDKVKFLLYPGTSKLNKTESMLDVISEMEKDGKLSEDHLETLRDALGEILRNDLCQKVESYERQQGCEAAKLSTTIENLAIQESASNDTVSSTRSETDRDSPVPERHPEYKLDKSPHGWCLIINNECFLQANKRRWGTDRDAEAIRKVFEARDYMVEEHKDLTGNEILRIMKEYQEKDHSKSDSFVCFVLSHGGKGIVFGTDEQEVPIKNLTNYVNGQNCESLRGKPKVFFLQACQGEEYDKGVPYHSDSIGPTYEDDGKGGRLPTNADFLTGFATVEDYVALRNTRHGSVYIQELCSTLIDPLYFQDDLPSILTTLHRSIANEVYRCGRNNRVVTQMPSYKSELRKRLILPPPSNEDETS